jgi:hypothetical protein
MLYSRVPSTYHSTTLSYSRLYDKYSFAIDGLSQLTNVSKSSRLVKYQAELKKLVQLDKDENVYTGVTENPNILAAFVEAGQIIQVADFLKTYLNENVLSDGNLIKLQAGMLNYADSINDDPSRNTFFELLVASHLDKTGIKVDLSKKTDIIADFEDFKVFIECKRVSSETKYNDRIKEAIKQLERRFTKGKTKEFGLVFISATSILNPKLNIRESSDPLKACQFAENMSKGLSNQYLEKNQYPKEKKILAFYTHFFTPFTNVPLKNLGLTSFYNFNSFFYVNLLNKPLYSDPQTGKKHPRSQYFEIFSRFDKRFKSDSVIF